MKPFLWNFGMFVTQKSCVKKFGGGNINKIYSGTISNADGNTMPHCLTSNNKHAIKLYNAINGCCIQYKTYNTYFNLIVFWYSKCGQLIDAVTCYAGIYGWWYTLEFEVGAFLFEIQILW